MTLSAWNNSLKRAEAAQVRTNERRQTVREEKVAGIYQDPRDKYLDSYGKPKHGIHIPQWFYNLSNAWAGDLSVEDYWRDYRLKTIDNIGIDPNKQKKPGRPKLLSHQRKSSIRPKRSDEMRELLLSNNIHLTEPPLKYDPKYLVEHPEWEFLVNGRLRHKAGAIISVHKFLSNLQTP